MAEPYSGCSGNKHTLMTGTTWTRLTGTLRPNKRRTMLNGTTSIVTAEGSGYTDRYDEEAKATQRLTRVIKIGTRSTTPSK